MRCENPDCPGYGMTIRTSNWEGHRPPFDPFETRDLVGDEAEPLLSLIHSVKGQS